MQPAPKRRPGRSGGHSGAGVQYSVFSFQRRDFEERDYLRFVAITREYMRFVAERLTESEYLQARPHPDPLPQERESAQASNHRWEGPWTQILIAALISS
jgi:hypothetical protein